MIPRSGLIKGLSIGVAAGLVVGVSQLTQSDNSAKIAGGGAPASAQLGTRFEDMAVGTLDAEPAEEITPTPTPEPPETAEALTPTPTPPAPTAAAAPPRAEPVETAQIAEPMPVAPPAALAAETPVLPSLTPVETPPETTEAVPTLTPTAPVPPTETVTAEAPDEEAPRLSQRPQRRDPERAAEAAKKAKPKPQPKPKPKQTARGNAKRDNTKGAQTTSRTGNAAQAGTRRQAAAPSGNAAVSNYPGKVMSRIARVGKPRVRSRGTAVIAFSVGNGGQLAGARVARSSGSAALDQAALGIIRQAAPFPRPPAGAQRNFSIQIKGR